MGIFHSTTRLLSPDKEEEDKTLSYQVLQNHHINIRCEDSSAKLLTFSFPSSIFKSLIWLLRKVASILYLVKAADPHPLLPVQNPASSISTKPLLPQTQSLPIYAEGSNEGGDVSQKIMRVAGAVAVAAVLVEENGCRNVCELKEEERTKKKKKEKKKKSRYSINVVVEEERWIKHYSSRHKILLVGEGDFSFSACVAKAFGSATNIIATSLNSEAFLKRNYGRAMSNLAELRSRGSKVMHEIDATEIARHPLLRRLKYDRIIFNFPFAGFFKDLPRDTQVGLHRTLVSGFMENAKKMIGEDGEIHITHKTNGFHNEWKLGAVASLHGLRLVEAVSFNNVDYPGYNTKCGFGGDNNFDCNPSKTFKFRLLCRGGHRIN